MKILIVEDDLEISKLLADFLQGNGYEVLCQYDGLHVLDCIQEHQIDLILLDIMLPYRSGDTILADIRKFSTVPVIVISAKETTQNKIDLLRLGADDYITKPFDMEEVLARIESNLRRIQFQNSTPSSLKCNDLVLDLDGNRAITYAQVCGGDDSLVTFNCERICYTGIAYEIPGQDLLKGEFVSKCLEYRVYQRGQHLECPY